MVWRSCGPPQWLSINSLKHFEHFIARVVQDTPCHYLVLSKHVERLLIGEDFAVDFVA
jgi:hypothetical protein